MSTDPVRDEVIRHHRVIQRWLTGAADRSEPAVFAGAHAPGFTLVTPDGVTLTRDEVLAHVEAAHGRVPDLVITIEDVHVVAESGDLVVATYVERHDPGRDRRATVVLSGRLWLHLHETWLA